MEVRLPPKNNSHATLNDNQLQFNHILNTQIPQHIKLCLELHNRQSVAVLVFSYPATLKKGPCHQNWSRSLELVPDVEVSNVYHHLKFERH